MDHKSKREREKKKAAVTGLGRRRDSTGSGSKTMQIVEMMISVALTIMCNSKCD